MLDEVAELGWPVFVKPARGGSSIGTSRVDSADELEAAIEEARRYDKKVLVEAAIAGAEVECAVLEGLDGAAPEASVPGMIVVDPHATWYDFEAKYLAAESRMEIPAPIPAGATERVRALACAAFDAIGCEGLARVDFFYTTSGEVLVNEINTMPGMTPSSGFPMMWAASGLAAAAADRQDHHDRAGEADALGNATAAPDDDSAAGGRTSERVLPVPPCAAGRWPALRVTSSWSSWRPASPAPLPCRGC